MPKLGTSISINDPEGGGTFSAAPVPQNEPMAWSDGTAMEWSNTGGNIAMEWSG